MTNNKLQCCYKRLFFGEFMRINISTVSQVFQAISAAFKAIESLVTEINAALKPTVSVPASTSVDATAPTDADDQSVTP